MNNMKSKKVLIIPVCYIIILYFVACQTKLDEQKKKYNLPTLDYSFDLVKLNLKNNNDNYNELYYDTNTNIVYCCDNSRMFVYISTNGNYIKYDRKNNKLVELIKK